MIKACACAALSMPSFIRFTFKLSNARNGLQYGLKKHLIEY